MIATCANLVWLAALSGAESRYRRQLGSPDEAQAAVLQRLLATHAATDYGREHQFSSIRSGDDYARQVPITTYDDLRPWIARIRAGEPHVLTANPVTRFIPTSGSSGARKLIPFTAGFHGEFDAAIGPWIVDLYRRHPCAAFGPSYWSISPANHPEDSADSAVPIGFDDDTSYLGGAWRRLVASTLAVSSEVRHAPDMEAFQFLTLASLLRRRDLRLISVWHPSFLLLLLDALPLHWDKLMNLLHTGRLPAGLTLSTRLQGALHLGPQPRRARELQRIGPTRPDLIWPFLTIISCWTEAHASLGASQLAHRLPQAVVQPKGLLATEGIVTIPYAGAHPAAINSHYYEFLDESGNVHPVGALEDGRTYEVIITTGAGLWRYRLGDRVRVDGFVNRTPSLRFVGRAGDVSDLRGEKLTGEFAASIISRLEGATPPRFAMLAADTEGVTGTYTLFWEGDLPPTAAEVDRLLAENPHYAWCRQLGQLRPARVFQVTAGSVAAYYARLHKSGQRLGDIKVVALSAMSGWQRCFTGSYVE